MVGTMIVEVTSRWSASSTVAASKRSTMRNVQPARICDSEKASGAPWNRADTLRWRPWSGRRMTSLIARQAANISAKGLPASTKRCTPLGRPVVPDVYDMRQPPTSYGRGGGSWAASQLVEAGAEVDDRQPRAGGGLAPGVDVGDRPPACRRRRRRSRPRRPSSRVFTGVTTMPARKAAKSASTNSWRFVACSTTWAPGSTPSAQYPLARRFVRSSSSRQVSVRVGDSRAARVGIDVDDLGERRLARPVGVGHGGVSAPGAVGAPLAALAHASAEKSTWPVVMAPVKPASQIEVGAVDVAGLAAVQEEERRRHLVGPTHAPVGLGGRPLHGLVAQGLAEVGHHRRLDRAGADAVHAHALADGRRRPAERVDDHALLREEVRVAELVDLRPYHCEPALEVGRGHHLLDDGLALRPARAGDRGHVGDAGALGHQREHRLGEVAQPEEVHP